MLLRMRGWRSSSASVAVDLTAFALERCGGGGDRESRRTSMCGSACTPREERPAGPETGGAGLGEQRRPAVGLVPRLGRAPRHGRGAWRGRRSPPRAGGGRCRVGASLGSARGSVKSAVLGEARALLAVLLLTRGQGSSPHKARHQAGWHTNSAPRILCLARQTSG